MTRKGSTSARGYGWKHQRLREQWKRVVDAGADAPARRVESIDNAILSWVKKNPGKATRVVLAGVGGNTQDAAKRLDALVLTGHIVRQDGQGNAKLHYLPEAVSEQPRNARKHSPWRDRSCVSHPRRGKRRKRTVSVVAETHHLPRPGRPARRRGLVMSLPTNLDQHLDDRCDRCEHPYLWCECMPAYFTRAAFQDIDVINQLLDRWQAEDPDACRRGLATIMRLWGATRRARGWE